MLKTYSKILDILEKIAKAFLAITAAAMVLVLFYQVVMRYIFNNAAAWPEELARYLFIYDVMVAAAIAVRRNSHLQIDALIGTGTNALKGISASVTASSTAIPATLTKAALLGVMAALGGNYQQGAIWIMTPEMFFNEVMALTALNDYIINDGFQYKLFGHDVVLMSEAKISSKENIFYGDPKAYKVNIFKAIEVKPFETATTTNLQFRGACLADGELLDTAAFVRFQRSGT